MARLSPHTGPIQKFLALAAFAWVVGLLANFGIEVRLLINSQGLVVTGFAVATAIIALALPQVRTCPPVLPHSPFILPQGTPSVGRSALLLGGLLGVWFSGCGGWLRCWRLGIWFAGDRLGIWFVGDLLGVWFVGDRFVGDRLHRRR